MSITNTIVRGSRIVFGKTSFIFRKHGGDMLIYGGLGLLGLSIVSTGIGTVKTVEAVSDYKEEVSKIDEMKVKEEEKAPLKNAAFGRCAWRVFKAYAPAVTFAVTGTTFVCCGRNVWQKKYAGVSALSALYSETLEKYRERWREEVGEEKEREVFENVQTSTVTETNAKGKEKTTEVKTPAGSGHPLEFIFDERNLKYRKYAGNNYYALMSARKQANNILNARGWIVLAEVLTLIGMPVPGYANYIGWVKDPMNREKIRFGMEADDELRYSSNQIILLKFNCDKEGSDLFDTIDIIEQEKYGYRCDIA